VNTDEAARLRREYEADGLDELSMAGAPIDEFRRWLDGVIAADLPEPNAFVLATADDQARPSARAVLMKSFSDEGIVFYTNLESRKSLDLKANPLGAATFVWTPLHRQVRFEGSIEPVSADEADEYFSQRPRGAQIAAHASDQSTEVESRSFLESKYDDTAARFEGLEIPRPVAWGGWRLRLATVEFWQGQVNRFHDRIRYRRSGTEWIKERLAP